MKLVAHHVYTSFGGYKTVHCCDDLRPQQERLESQAENLISGEQGFVIRRDAQAWWVIAIRKNGFDHVGRPRSLVHTIAVDHSQNKLPLVFSPAFLLVLTLDRLEHEDPGLSYRLPTTMADLPQQLSERGFDQLVTNQELLRECLRGEARSLFIASYDAMAAEDEITRIRNSVIDGIVDNRLAAGLLPFWVHQQDCVISNLRHMVVGDAGVAKLYIDEAIESARITQSGRMSIGHILIELFNHITEPISLFWLLAALPNSDRLNRETMRALYEAVAKYGWPLTLRSVQKGLGLKDNMPCLHVLSAVTGLGGLKVLHQLLFEWRSQQTNLDPEVQELLDARLVALSDDTTAVNLLQLLQEEKLLI